MKNQTINKESKINPIRLSLEKEIAKRGIKISKLISEGSSGLFHYQPATYDKRTVYSKEELYKLSKEGFLIDSSDILSCLIFDAILKTL